ncbi:ATPase involved in DNA repair [Candidatus Burkholderia verschuerenii]|uniref:ATPase involved in DNA repair n=1 Tax=Candidatus Burkholderia verschuerenii TaxID=242163 RepID=A0A0L0MBQ0_9BURK|nr:periplasmic heavy metal sensor [Candidatus Burkholderia verschuerenii]KND59404.1 ATPase involved in DNA repair [Candidatus Burkholderia verschuerenii]
MGKQYRILTAAATAIALTIGTAYAASNDAPPAPPPGGPGMMMGGPGGHRMEERMKKQMDELHAQLKLNADQEKLWQTALDTMKQNRKSMFEAHKQLHDQFKSMENQPILDLNAMHDAHQKMEAQDSQLREQTTGAWLNFYNALNDQQKTTVSSALKKHFERMRDHEHRMHERWGKGHGGPGAASAASAPAKP